MQQPNQEWIVRFFRLLIWYNNRPNFLRSKKLKLVFQREHQSSHEMIILNDLENQEDSLKYHNQKKSSQVQTDKIIQNRSTSTDNFAANEISQTDSLEDARYATLNHSSE